MKILQVYVDFVEDLEPLSDAEVGRLFKAMLLYAADDNYSPPLKGNERITWATAKKTLKKQWQEYREMCERNKNIATTRYESLRESTKKHDSNQDKEKTNKIKDNSKRNIKEKYGRYKNVLLTAEDLAALKAEFSDWEERIERLSEYIASKGDHYKSHLATIRSWARKDGVKPAKETRAAPTASETAELKRLTEIMKNII